MSVIKTENLTYTYIIGTPFEKTAVDNVNLEIEEGATLKATLAQGLVGIGKTEEVKLLTSDNDFENNFTDVMENNMYSFVKKEGDTGVYEIRQTKTAQDVIEENGGSSVNQGSASAWVYGDSFENDRNIDGNLENMTVDVAGSVLFLCATGKAALYPNVTIQNHFKKNNRVIKK